MFLKMCIIAYSTLLNHSSLNGWENYCLNYKYICMRYWDIVLRSTDDLKLLMNMEMSHLQNLLRFNS